MASAEQQARRRRTAIVTEPHPELDTRLHIAMIGVGYVGGALADHFQRLGHTVHIGARDPLSHSVRMACKRNHALRVTTIRDAIECSSVVVLAVPFDVCADSVRPYVDVLSEHDERTGMSKILVDCNNPVSADLTHSLESRDSSTQLLQRLLPKTRVVKAFSVCGFKNFEFRHVRGVAGEGAYGSAHGIAGGVPSLMPSDKPMRTMPICGEDLDAKQRVGRILAEIDWEPVDVGGAAEAVHLEHMTLLWIKMVGVRKVPNFVWSMVSREV